MKAIRTNIRRWSVAGLLACALPLAAQAAPQFPGAGDCGRLMPARVSWKGGPGAAEGMRHMGPLSGLDLSEEQRDKAFALMHEQAPRLREAAKAHASAHDALRKFAMSDSYDAAAARKLADEVARAEADMSLLRAEMGAKMRQLLTPEQRKQFDAKLASDEPGRGERGFGRGPGRDGKRPDGAACRSGMAG